MPALPHGGCAAAAGALWAAALFAAERLRPLRRQTRPLAARLAVNAVFALLAAATVAAAVRPAALWAMQARTQHHPLALLPPQLRFVASFLLMDLTFYWWHRANHVMPLLWRFHNVHHLDPDLDLSTAFRFHFGELFLSSAFRIVQLIAIAPPTEAWLLYELFFQGETMFHHANVRLPQRLERALLWVAVAPRMHGIHHSRLRRETNANFGSVFTWWDRLHGTLRLEVPQEVIAIGVPGYARPGDNALAAALLHPFRRQRSYWNPPEEVPLRRH